MTDTDRAIAVLGTIVGVMRRGGAQIKADRAYAELGECLDKISRAIKQDAATILLSQIGVILRRDSTYENMVDAALADSMKILGGLRANDTKR